MNIIETRRQMTMAHIGSHHSEAPSQRGATSAGRTSVFSAPPRTIGVNLRKSFQ